MILLVTSTPFHNSILTGSYPGKGNILVSVHPTEGKFKQIPKAHFSLSLTVGWETQTPKSMLMGEIPALTSNSPKNLVVNPAKITKARYPWKKRPLATTLILVM